METWWREDWLAGSGLSVFERGGLDLYSGKWVSHREEHPACPSPTFPNTPEGLIASWRTAAPKMKRESVTNKGADPRGTVTEHLWQKDEGSNWKNAMFLVPIGEVNETLSQLTACSLCQEDSKGPVPTHSCVTAFTHVAHVLHSMAMTPSCPYFLLVNERASSIRLAQGKVMVLSFSYWIAYQILYIYIGLHTKYIILSILYNYIYTIYTHTQIYIHTHMQICMYISIIYIPVIYIQMCLHIYKYRYIDI